METCPNCGSGAEQHEDNGLSPAAYEYTILCVARISPRESAMAHADSDVDDAGKVACGMQWSPNEG